MCISGLECSTKMHVVPSLTFIEHHVKESKNIKRFLKTQKKKSGNSWN